MTRAYQPTARDRAIADEVGGAMQQCRECSSLAEHETLASYGGLCGPCYGRYVRGTAGHPRLMSHAEKLAVLGRLRSAVRTMAEPKNPRAWAYRLREREEAGEILTRVQRDAWRTALRDGAHTEEAA